MKRNILCAIISCICTFPIHHSFSQGYLYITDPQWNWPNSEGLITEASYVLEAQGAYVQMEMIMEFSIDPQTNYGANDSLEAVYSFFLPKNAIVYDSWLWIDNYISYGIIMSEDSARQIYEDIVDRRTDPSILRRRGNTSYSLRIFPISKNMPRKVKISVLLPTEWTETKVSTTLPVEHIMPYLSGSDLEVLVKQDSLFPNPILPEDSSLVFQSLQHPFYGPVMQLSLQETDTVENQTLLFDSPLDNGLFASIYPTQQQEGYYQLAIFPSHDSLNIPPTRTLILLDYDSTNTPSVQQKILNIAMRELSPTDSFNFMFNSPTGIQAASNDWLPADSATLTQHLSPNQVSLSATSDLINLIREGLDFMDQQNHEGSIILISNSGDYPGYWYGTNALDSLDLGDTILVPMHISNVRKWDTELYWDPSICWYSCGNEYLFQILAQRSGGSVNTYRTYGESLNMILSHPFVTVTERAQMMSVSTNIGFDPLQLTCYEDAQPLNRAYVEVGKYSGSLPFQGTFSMQLHQQTVQFPFQINQADVHLSDTMLRKAWAGLKVWEIEHGPWYTEKVDDLVTLSVEERVLSDYTAFLCLEDSNANGFAEPSEPVSIEESVKVSKLSMRVYPNPFEDGLSIEIEIHNLSPRQQQESQLVLYTLQGQMVRTWVGNGGDLTGVQNLLGLVPGHEGIQLYWDGLDMQGQEVPGGMYILMLQGPDIREAVRLLKR